MTQEDKIEFAVDLKKAIEELAERIDSTHPIIALIEEIDKKRRIKNDDIEKRSE